jgi:ATP-dependent exoDNAse (exonuclease V) beta subunit
MQIAKAKTDGAVQRTMDRFESMIALHEEAARSSITVDAAIAKLLETPKHEAFTLGTIHKMKGLEYPNVTYFDYWDEKPAVGQENNIKYVGVTRAQENLILHKDLT